MPYESSGTRDPRCRERRTGQIACRKHVIVRDDKVFAHVASRMAVISQRRARVV